MKKIFFLLALNIISIYALAQKIINDPNAEVRNVKGFHALSISNAFEVILTQGNEESLAVSASDKDYIQHIKTSVDNGVLKIWFDEKVKWVLRNRKLKAYISVINLDRIKTSGATSLRVENELKTNSLVLDLSGASEIRGKFIINGKLEAELSGASDISISGSADECKIDASGASDVKAFDFKTNTCNVKATGASEIRITVEKELSAKLSGASNVSYKGSALIKDIKTSGASSISRRS